MACLTFFVVKTNEVSKQIKEVALMQDCYAKKPCAWSLKYAQHIDAVIGNTKGIKNE